MKTKKFWFVMAAAVILTGMVCTSCNSDDDPIVPPVPEVVESEVLDSGCSSDVAENSGTEGTSLSYESWIYVRQTTRATSDAKISVTLFNRFNNLVQEAEVTDFDFGTPESDISYRFADSRTEQNFVTVTDSVLVYGLTYANGFRLEYELMFETPEYNDGVTKQQMPYHKIENITDNGMTLSGMDNQTVDGKEWHRKLLRHSITVSFNGRQYEVAASVVVRSEVPAEDVLLSSSKVDEGLELVSTDAENASGTYRSWLKVEQNWSESGVKIVEKEVLLKYRMQFPMNSVERVVTEKYADLNNFSVENGVYETETTQGELADNVAVDTYHISYFSRFVKNENTQVKVSAYFDSFEEKARYQDDKLNCEFPSYGFSEPQVSWKLVSSWSPNVIDGMNVEEAEYRTDYAIMYKENVYTAGSSFKLIFIPAE